jgi:hypothetical protein
MYTRTRVLGPRSGYGGLTATTPEDLGQPPGGLLAFLPGAVQAQLHCGLLLLDHEQPKHRLDARIGWADLTAQGFWGAHYVPGLSARRV